MIKIYPSVMGRGEPIETHEITNVQSIAQWLSENVRGFTMQKQEHPISVFVNGKCVTPSMWDTVKIDNDTDVIILPTPKGVDSIIIAVIAVVALTVAAFTMAGNKAPKERQKGLTIDGADINANTVRWGDPIPEIAGSPISYPAILAPQHKWYGQIDDATSTEYSEMLLCVGMGEYSVTSDDVRIGTTPVALLSDSVSVNFYAPNADTSIGSNAYQWWHTSQEVGFTTFGGSGMTLGGLTSVPTQWTGGHTRNNATTIQGPVNVPTEWSVGMKLRDLQIIHLVEFGTNWVSSDLLDNADIAINDYLRIAGENGQRVSAITPASGASAGNVASVYASAAPSRFDFDVTPVTFTVTLAGITYWITLDTSMAVMNDVINGINQDLNGSPLRAVNSGNRVLINQQGSPNGATISISGSYSDIMGSPTLTQGVAPSTGSRKRYQIAAASFVPGTIMTDADRQGVVYEITGKTSTTLTIRPSTMVSWAGMPAESELPYTIFLHQDSYEVGWCGPFRATPEGVQCTKLEVDIFLPEGLISYNKEGKTRSMTVNGVIQFRKIGVGGWTSYPFTKTATTPNQMGYTFQITVDNGEYEVRVRASGDPSSNTRVNDTMQWSGLKALVNFEKKYYPNMTTMSVLMQSGDKIGGAVENKVSVRATRKLTPIAGGALAPTRDLAPFLRYMMQTVGYSDYLDSTLLSELNTKWAGKTFDLEIAAESTLKTMANNLLRAGNAELTIKRGWITPVINEAKPDAPTRIFGTSDFIAPLTQTIITHRPDEPDGIEGEYVEYETGKKVTTSYLMPDDAGLRKQSTKIVGITNGARAYNVIKLQRRMAALERVTFEFQTEMSGFSLQYMDKIGIQDGTVEYGQSTFAKRKTQNIVFTTDKINGTSGTVYVGLRKPDGTLEALGQAAVDVTRMSLTFDGGTPAGIVDITESVNHSILYIGESQKYYYEALVTEVTPNADGTATIKAKGYVPEVYS